MYIHQTYMQKSHLKLQMRQNSHLRTVNYLTRKNTAELRCFINVNQCCYRPVKGLESHGVLHWSGIFKIQRFALFGPFSSFFRAFSAGKAKTSDFLRQNHGCLPSKVPMFYLKKSDVLAAETRCFQHLLPSFRPFLRRTSCKTS